VECLNFQIPINYLKEVRGRVRYASSKVTVSKMVEYGIVEYLDYQNMQAVKRDLNAPPTGGRQT